MHLSERPAEPAFVASAGEAAERLAGCRYLIAEFMYQPRPVEARAQAVFDYALRSRWNEAGRTPGAALLLICNDEATAASLAGHLEAHATLPAVGAVVNPPTVSDTDSRTPWLAGWPQPERWRRYAFTDRWARILFALDVARQLETPGCLVMPANDAVWGQGMLARLTAFSQAHGRNGVPAAVSPYTFWQHSPVPGVEIDPRIIAALNAGFNRDSSFRERVLSGQAQAFWGKMSLLPFAVCDTALRHVETQTWEDDLEIDRVLKEANYAVRCLWVDQRALYRQALPVFDRDGLGRVFERTLHYSLNLPAPVPAGTSLLHQPLDATNRLRIQFSRRYADAIALSEDVIAECTDAIAERLARYGCSWVDWGAYRYVVQVGDPWVQVWKYD